MKIIFTTIAFILCFNLGFSQNYNDALLLSQPGLYSDARALGMGNSFSSLSNDFAGVLFNPAGIGLMKKGEIYPLLWKTQESGQVDIKITLEKIIKEREN